MTQSVVQSSLSPFESIGEKYQTILFEANAEGIARLTLNRPQSLNSMTSEFWQEFQAACRTYANNSALRVLVVTGAGKAFCSGGDVKSMSTRTINTGEYVRTVSHPIIIEYANLAKPTVAAVNGVAAGAGVSLALASDFRVVSTAARFIIAFARIGLTPDCGLTYFLPRLIGTNRAMELAALGGEFSAQEAKEWGITSRLIAPEEFEQATLQLASQIATGPTQAIGAIKHLINHSFDLTFAEALEAEANQQIRINETADFREGVRAFVEKRPARFEGK